MKFLGAFALLFVLGVPLASAQQGQPPLLPEVKVQLELLEIEQDVDKTLLKEALLALGRGEMGLGADTLNKGRVDTIKVHVEKLKESIIKRSTEIKSLKEAPNRARREQASSQPNQMAKQNRQEQIEKLEATQVESQLLQRQVQMYQQALSQAIEALATAEFAAANDEKQKEPLEAARRQFDKAKSKYVEFSKKFQIEQDKMNELQQQAGMGGFR